MKTYYIKVEGWYRPKQESRVFEIAIDVHGPNGVNAENFIKAYQAKAEEMNFDILNTIAIYNL